MKEKYHSEYGGYDSDRDIVRHFKSKNKSAIFIISPKKYHLRVSSNKNKMNLYDRSFSKTDRNYRKILIMLNTERFA